MGTFKDKPNYGAVMIHIITKTRTILVWDELKHDPKWKIPCGSIEESDENLVAAAIREARDETGIDLVPKELHLYSEHREEDGEYYPFSFVASVSEEKLDARSEVGHEDSHEIKTGIFNRNEVLAIPDLLEKHRLFIREIELG